MAGDARKERSDKKKRIYPYLENEIFRRLNRIARACEVSPHEIAAEAVMVAVNNPSFIAWVQEKYGVEADDPFRVIPLVENGKVSFLERR